MDTSSKIRTIRLLNGIGQIEFARYLDMVTASHVNRWEQGSSIPRPAMLKKIGSVMRVNWPWLVDSAEPFSKEKIAFYRPLSPYLQYTKRWLALLPIELKKELPTLWAELKVSDYLYFESPCGGAIAVVKNAEFALVLSCHPAIAKGILGSMQNPQIFPISDAAFLEMMLQGKGYIPVLDVCGVEYNEDDIVEEELPENLSIFVSITTKIPREKYYDKLEEIISNKIHLLLDEFELDNIRITSKVHNKDRHQTDISKLILDPVFKQLFNDLKNNETES